MKKLLLFALILLSFVSYGQEYKDIFLGKDGSTYKGLYLKYKSGSISGMSHSFYSEEPQKSFQSPVYGKNEKYNFNTDTVHVRDREFLVVDVKPCSFCFDNNKFQTEDYIFELNDGKETIYYVYDGKYDFNFPFLVKGFSYSSDYVSQFIKKETDDFTGEVTITSPILNDVSLLKVIKKGSSTPIYYLDLETGGSTLNYNVKGVIVLFKDGSKWSKPEQKIDVRVSDGWRYSAFITLTQQDLQLFSSKEIDKFRLYIYDNHAPDETDKFVYYVQAITKMK